MNSIRNIVEKLYESKIPYKEIPYKETVEGKALVGKTPEETYTIILKFLENAPEGTYLFIDHTSVNGRMEVKNFTAEYCCVSRGRWEQPDNRYLSSSGWKSLEYDSKKLAKNISRMNASNDTRKYIGGRYQSFGSEPDILNKVSKIIHVDVDYMDMS